MFTQLFIMSTPTLKPKQVYKKTVTNKTMTEQTKPSLDTLTKVQSHLSDVQLISRDALWEDFKNRIKINNYECKQVMVDLKKVVKASQPYVDQAVNKVKELRSDK